MLEIISQCSGPSVSNLVVYNQEREHECRRYMNDHAMGHSNTRILVHNRYRWYTQQPCTNPTEKLNTFSCSHEYPTQLMPDDNHTGKVEHLELWHMLEIISQCSGPLSCNAVLYNAQHE